MGVIEILRCLDLVLDVYLLDLVLDVYLVDLVNNVLF